MKRQTKCVKQCFENLFYIFCCDLLFLSSLWWFNKINNGYFSEQTDLKKYLCIKKTIIYIEKCL